MDFEGKATTTTAPSNTEFAQSVTARKPLELLRDTEALLRRPAVAKLVPILPPKLSNRMQEASTVAETSLQELAEIDLEKITDWELQPVRLRVGLCFVGFGALMILVLLLYLNTLHPELSTVGQIHKYWYQYVWFVCFGIAGMFMIGRETMRPTVKLKKPKNFK
ncbi:hypothetical protein [Aulosira sp. FACHB-615]|uniref:hypothetical protein n=1 Tax=Aulosira sp. FACHB-615 TaxID=2692777 RepID=UPI001689002E|nr:hypothetical protein [Aulosira sp. FACHB-615]MBD2487085.1 hypothetical protein [Aulosira sp. FACHB-615]